MSHRHHPSVAGESTPVFFFFLVCLVSQKTGDWQGRDATTISEAAASIPSGCRQMLGDSHYHIRPGARHACAVASHGGADDLPRNPVLHRRLWGLLLQNGLGVGVGVGVLGATSPLTAPLEPCVAKMGNRARAWGCRGKRTGWTSKRRGRNKQARVPSTNRVWLLVCSMHSTSSK